MPLTKVQKEKEILKLNEIHQFLIYANGVTSLGENINTIKKNRGSSVRIGTEENAKKTRCMLMSHHKNTRQKHDMKRANRSFENVEKLKYSGATPVNEIVFMKKLRAD
jgi:hypothetical protein